jgi:hypothetical protein
MKLARVEHYRCGEPMAWKSGEGYTYVWVVDDMTEPQFDAIVEKAQKSYFDAEQAYKNESVVKAPPGYGPTIMPNTPGDKTVQELRDEYEVLAAAYKAHCEKVQAGRRPFGYWLEQHGEGRIKQFWSGRPDINVVLSWGHNHGMTIEHSPTVIKDYPFPADEDEL